MRDTADLKVWFREDIIHLLHGILVASLPAQSDVQFRLGFITALTAISASVGVDATQLLSASDAALLNHSMIG